jgi:hypothetical protein
MAACPCRRTPLWVLVAALTLSPVSALAQGTGGTTVRDDGVGYLDSAIPGNQLRLRLDTAYDFTRPDRGEFFYPKPGTLGGPGLPLPERKVDYQELTGYLEVALGQRLSGFVELPWRFLNPEVNANSNGLSDCNAGFKYAVVAQDDLFATFQLRTYAPTGDGRRGLGNDHVTLEPAFLSYERLTDRLAWDGEIRLWIPVGGTDFASDVVRYGAGVHYDLCQAQFFRVTPVIEFVGFTFLGGKESFALPGGLGQATRNASGDTILDAKVGVHLKASDYGDIYFGYGRPLTETRAYENIYRLEFRLFF